MKIALYSDLHLECARWVPPELDVDLVLLLGDIGTHTHGIEWAASTFSRWKKVPKIVYVAGNHEYYGAHLGLLSEFRKPKWALAGVDFLERQVLVYEDVRILGCTLWSGFELNGQEQRTAAMSAAQNGVDDYVQIGARGGRCLTAQDTLHLHRTAIRWLDQELAQPFSGKTIVATHFAPHRNCCAERYVGSSLSPYFVTDESTLMKRHQIDLWGHGHTHTNTDFLAENGCRILSNQRGYPYESKQMNFCEERIIEL